MYSRFWTNHFMSAFAVMLLSLLVIQPAWSQSSQNQMMSFEGTLTDNTGNAISLEGQQLYFYIIADDGVGQKCILFAESSTVSGDADGNINHKFGSGFAVTSPVSYNNSLSSSVFSGSASGKLADGGGNGCLVTAGAKRTADVYSAVLNITASVTLGTVPYSQLANNALTLNGKYDTDFILASSVSGGAVGQVLSRSAANGFAWVNLPAAGNAGITSIDLGSASATGTVSSARLADVVTAGTYTKVTVDTKGRVISSSALAATDIPNIDAGKITGGILVTARGGTGMTSIGGANQLLTVNNAGTALEYKAIAGTSGVTVTAGSGFMNVGLIPVGTAGTFSKVTTDTYGRVTAGQSLSASDVTLALGYTPSNAANGWQTSFSDLYYNAGQVTIGSNTFPYAGTKLFVKNSNGGSVPVAVFEQWDDSAYSAPLPAAYFSRRLPAGSTPQAGFGSTIHFYADDSAHNQVQQSVLMSAWASATAGNTYGVFSIATKDSSGGTTTKIYADQTGVYVPNGNLLVSGSIRVGGDGNIFSHSCATNEAGKQRYNSNYKTMEFCDGLNWRGMNGITYCDSGYSMVGNPGSAAAFCIDNTVNATADYETASNTCGARGSSIGSRPKVCSVQQLDTVCSLYSTVNLTNFNNGIFHWTSNPLPVAGTTTSPANIRVRYQSSIAGGCHINPTSGPPYNGRQADAGDVTSALNYRCCYE